MKLIAMDIDGTLVNSRHKVTELTRNTIAKYNNDENKFVIFTGRDISTTMFIAEEVGILDKGGLISSSNGAYVLDLYTDNVVADHILSRDIIEEIATYAKEFDLEFGFYDDGYIITDAPDSEVSKYFANKNRVDIKEFTSYDQLDDYNIHKVMFYKEEDLPVDVYNKIRDKFGNELNITQSMPMGIEIMPEGINKGASLVEIAEYYGISMDDTIAFGDQLNDYEMIKYAGTGVAMGNAVDAIKEIADYVTLSNDEDGIAHFLEEHL